MSAWLEIQVIVPRVDAEEIGAMLIGLGALGIQEDWIEGQAPPIRQPWDQGPVGPLPDSVLLRAWWPEGSEPVARLERSLGHRPGVTIAAPLRCEDLDWAEGWKEGLTRLVIGGGLAVAPPWAAEEGDLVLEPGMAFGAGDHPTTRACLEGVLAHAVAGGRCLDVGCGSGVLALAAVRCGMTAWGVDVDGQAVAASRSNARRNGLEARFDETPLSEVTGDYDLVVANIYAEVLVGLAPDLVRCTLGHLVLAGILADREHMVLKALEGMPVVERVQDGEWVSLICRAAALR